ncbi:MAG: threonine synthase, partial [Actinomycetia bacterium]|nr:threonine synthase [Actinomycetes bacterium]
MTNVVGLTCVICDKTYPADYAEYVCPDHGNEGILDVRYDYEKIGETFTKESLAADPDRTMWRYRPLLPISPDAVVPPLTVGGTPMYDAVPLAEQLGL